MSENLAMYRRGYSGGAIATLAVGVMSMAAIPVFPAAVLPLGVVALVLGLVSRRELKADASLRGARLSLAGFILGIIGIYLGGAVPLFLMLLWKLFGFSD